MDFNDTPEEAAFRKEVRAWLDANATRKSDDRQAFRARNDDPELLAKAKAWQAKKATAGYARMTWPKEYGGRGASPILQVIYQQEEANYLVPLGFFDIGLGMCIPTMMAYAKPEQLDRYVKPALHGDEVWCQLFSEPAAGSDVAGIRTRAERDGDGWVINGQKVWTTQAQHADYVFLMVRTDPDAPQHAGISYLLVPMHQPGVEVRPIIQVDGSAEFNEVFFTNARCPKGNVVGGVNNGWKVAMTTLGFERGSSSTTGYRRFLKEWDFIVAEARRTKRNTDPLVRDRIIKNWEQVKIMQINGYRSLTDSLNDTHNAALLGACNKMFWSEMHRDSMELALDVQGMESQILTGNGSAEGTIPGQGRGREDYPVSDIQASFFFSRSETIWGGTAEIQRNIIGERALGLPKEPKAAKAN